MAANSTSFDLVTELLSTNNTIDVVALTCAILFGVLAIYASFLTSRHQRWERQLREERSARRTDDAETGSSTNAYPMRDLEPGSDGETGVEHAPDTASTGGSSNQSAPSFVESGEHIIPGRTAIEGIVAGGARDGNDNPGNAAVGMEGEASRPPAVTGNQTVPTSHNDSTPAYHQDVTYLFYSERLRTLAGQLPGTIKNLQERVSKGCECLA